MERRGYIDAEDFSPGYMARSMHTFPSQGDREPWINSQDYYQEAKSLPEADLGDGTLIFDNPAKRAASK